ncbi:LytR/AlgR family response regulator transcription factor [Algoriphagus sp.]|uniref:LytR/AlgR family response regulator transcription factor n=1 Tax=Algoriphagus sp. TaxID=1872435 RepID=UPI00391B6F13
MNKPITALIVDDEPIARLSLRGILEEFFPNVLVIGEAKNLPDGIKLIHKYQPDVVFMDIEMPGFSGLEVLDFFPEGKLPSKLVFVTAYQEYALRAFELSAFDYLLKPVQKEGIARALEKLTPTEKVQLEILKQNPSDKITKIILQTGEGMQVIELKSIIYLKADGSYTHFYFTGGKKITISKRLSEFEKLLTLGRFMRIHRSHLINLDQIQKISKENGGEVIMSDGECLSLSTEKKAVLLEAMGMERL